MSKSIERAKFLRENDEEWFLNYKTNLRKGLSNYYENGGTNGFDGKKHTDESKQKMSKSKKGIVGIGTDNSQYGTRWIHSLEEKRSKKISKGDELPEGWIEGRKIKF